jgi:hypothetical protein
MARIPADRYVSPCSIGESEPVTLEFVIGDYLAHLKHHVAQIRVAWRRRGSLKFELLESA